MLASRSEGDLRLAAPAVIAWVIAWWAIGCPRDAIGAFPVASAGLVAGAIALLVAAVVVRRPTTGCSPAKSRVRGAAGALSACAVCGAIAAAVLLTVWAGQAVRNPEGLDDRSGSVDVLFRVEGLPRVDVRGDVVMDAVLTRVRDADGLGVPVRVRVPASEPDGGRPEFSPGDVVTATARVRPAEPGERASYRLEVSRSEVSAGPPPVLSWPRTLRDSLLTASASLPAPGAELVPGLADGDERSVTPELNQAMTASGLTHLTAVSGANCAIVVAATAFAVSRAGGRRRVRTLVSLGALAGFVMLVTPTASVLRASVLCAIVLLARLAGRPSSGVPALCLATMILIGSDPWLSRDFGFALSVAATAGLLVSARPLAEKMACVLPRWLATAIAVPLAAQLWCQPILVLLRPEVALISVPANLLAAPAAAAAAIAGLIACVLGALIPPLAVPLAWVVWIPAQWIASVATFFAGLHASAPWPSGPAGAILAILASLLVLGATLARRRASRLVLRALVAVSLAAGSGWIQGSALISHLNRPADWDVAACDVGQGDAFLIRSAGATALVDTGREPAALTRCLDSLGVSTVDLLVLTHYDQDHAGGLPAVASRVARALVGPEGRPADSARLALLERAGVDLVRAATGDRGALGDATWRILWPRPGERSAGNASSITIEFCASYCALFLGDLDADAQRAVAGSVRDVDLITVAHHGSADQFPPFYDRARAEAAIVSSGAGNPYGHPTASALDMLSADATVALRTDQRGMILLSFEDGAWSAWSERAVDGRDALPAGRSG